jgi:ketosteroid isomerase-like protein
MPETRLPADRPADSAADSRASTPADVFDRLVHGVGAKRWDELPALYAERTHVIHPMDPARAPALTTPAELDQHFRRGAEALGEVRFEPAAITVHQTTDPEVIVAEFEYRGVIPGTADRFALPSVFVMRIRDGQIVASRDYVDHAGIGRVLGRQAPEPQDWEDRARRRYEDAFFDDEPAQLDLADAELDLVEAGLALARGRIMHARFLADGELDPATLAQFERAAELYARAGDGRGEAEARFWAGTFHQVGRDDDQAARPLLERSAELARAAGDRLTLSYAVRHLGFAEEAAGRLEAAREQLAESLRLRRELGFERGVSAALLALAENARARGDQDAARALLAEAGESARRAGARGILRRIEAEEIEAEQIETEQIEAGR